MCTQTKTQHIHAEFIKAWADGAKIQVKHTGIWHDLITPLWDAREYRIKPEPQPDVVRYARASFTAYTADCAGSTANEQATFTYWTKTKAPDDNIKAVFDGETDELKSVSLIKE